MNSHVVAEIRRELKASADPKTSSGYARFFKEAVKFYGVESSKVSKITREYFPEIKPLGKTEIFAICEELFKSDFNEEAFIACDWSYRIHSQYEESDFAIFERWVVNYVNNWAKCDTLCNHTVGSLVIMFPQYIENLKQWTKSENRWVKRAAAVTLIIPAKQGKFLKDIFEIADSLLLDKDDLVQKGYGWLLKDAAITHRKEVFEYVMKNKKIMPRTALRYASERFPVDLRKKAMEK